MTLTTAEVAARIETASSDYERLGILQTWADEKIVNVRHYPGEGWNVWLGTSVWDDMEGLPTRLDALRAAFERVREQEADSANT